MHRRMFGTVVALALLACGEPAEKSAARAAAEAAIRESAPVAEAVASPRAPVAAAPSAAPAGPAAQPAPAQAGPIVGIGAHQMDARSVAAVRDLGLRHLRTTLYPSLWRDNPDWRREFDEGIERARAAGLDLLVVVHEPSTHRFSPAERRETAAWFADFMATVAREYRGKVEAWQLWNEMDVAAFTDAFGARSELAMRERGRLYAEQLKLAYPAIKAADPEALVVTGGMASGPKEGFLDAVLQAGGPFDAVAVHTYGFPLQGVFEAKAEQTREILARHGLQRPVWNTEFGLEAKQIPWPNPQRVIDRLQQETWEAAIEGNEEERLYDRIYGYQLWTEEDVGHGILRADFTPRPTYEWIRERYRR